MKLDIAKLISVGEDLVRDNQLGSANTIEYPVHKFISESGDNYELSIKAKLTNKKSRKLSGGHRFRPDYDD